jgi:hypothetical protein
MGWASLPFIHPWIPSNHHSSVLTTHPDRSFDQQSFANHSPQSFVVLIMPQWDVIGQLRRRQAGVVDNAVKDDLFLFPNLARPYHLLSRHPAGGGVVLAA